jgi:hypothetical protein
MGNAAGCCTPQTEQGNVEVGKKPSKSKAHAGYERGNDELLDVILDDREIGGRTGEDKIELVEKIQATARGQSDRKKVANIKSKKELS